VKIELGIPNKLAGDVLAGVWWDGAMKGFVLGALVVIVLWLAFGTKGR